MIDYTKVKVTFHYMVAYMYPEPLTKLLQAGNYFYATNLPLNWKERYDHLTAEIAKKIGISAQKITILPNPRLDSAECLDLETGITERLFFVDGDFVSSVEMDKLIASQTS